MTASPSFPWFPLNVGGDGEDIGGPPAPVGGESEDIGAPAAPDGGVEPEDNWRAAEYFEYVPYLGDVILEIPAESIPFPSLPLNVGGDGEDIGDTAPPPGIEHEDIG